MAVDIYLIHDLCFQIKSLLNKAIYYHNEASYFSLYITLIHLLKNQVLMTDVSVFIILVTSGRGHHQRNPKKQFSFGFFSDLLLFPQLSFYITIIHIFFNHPSKNGVMLSCEGRQIPISIFAYWLIWINL